MAHLKLKERPESIRDLLLEAHCVKFMLAHVRDRGRA